MNNLLLYLTLLILVSCQVQTSDSGPVATSSPVVATISSTSNVIANNTATATITITLTQTGAPLVGTTPSFSATGSGNSLGSCSASDGGGVSTCTLRSTKAETKTLKVTSPSSSATASTTFISGSPSASTSTISNTGITVADGVASANVVVTVLDPYSNPVAGQTPTFSATNTGGSNVYGTCSTSNASGVSTCSLKSLKAEIKSLQLLTPVSVAGGNAVFIGAAPVAINSSIIGTSPVAADGVTASTITISLKDVNNNPSSGYTPSFTATNTGGSNTYGACSPSDLTGISTCTLRSTTPETKTLSIATPFVKTGGTVEFTSMSSGPVAANSTISGSGTVVADGVDSSTIIITLRDNANAGVAGITPTFAATDTSSTNVYGSCSVSNASGVSTCSLKSTVAEIKSLSIVTPVAKIGSSVTFIAGAASASNSTITGSSPVVADGSANSTITILLKDTFGNTVSGTTPTFTATDTGTSNVYSACSVSDAIGISTCTLSSLVAESKTLQLLTPVSKQEMLLFLWPVHQLLLIPASLVQLQS